MADLFKIFLLLYAIRLAHDFVVNIKTYKILCDIHHELHALRDELFDSFGLLHFYLDGIREKMEGQIDG